MPPTFARASWAASVADDAWYAGRQLLRRKLATAAAIISLGLAMGACLAAFQLTDGLLFRPLPIGGADRLHVISHLSQDANGQPRWIGAYEYPLFARLRDAARPQAELLAASPAERLDVTYRSDAELETASVQYVSGALFTRFGLRPAAGRLFTDADDRTPGAHPVALITHDYWRRRLGGDPGAIGRTVRVGAAAFTIVGVVQPGFAGTETGTVTDVFLPTAMNRAVTDIGDSWIRILVHLEPGVSAPSLRDRLTPVFVAFREEKSRGMRGTRPELVQRFLSERMTIDPAPSGVSGLQQEYRRPLLALGLLVALVLGIACVNLAQLQAAQTAARGSELALRAAIGAGRRRLVQMVVVESLLVATLATVVGWLFAAWATRHVLQLIGGAEPVRLDLAPDWRVATFACLLGLVATASFGLAPVWRSAALRPMPAIRGGADDRRRRLAPVLIAVQSAFCAVIVVLAALFVATFDRIAHQPMGFAADGVVLVDVFSRSPQPLAGWDDASAALASIPGVERVAMAAYPLLSGQSSNGFIAIAGGAPERTLSTFLSVSPGWLDAMRVSLVAGRDFGPADARPGSAIVNQAFADTYFAGVDPVGRTFDRTNVPGHFTIVGVVANVRYRELRGAIQPTAFLPFRVVESTGQAAAVWGGTFVVRTGLADPGALGTALRRTLAARQPALLVRSVRTQRELVDLQTRRERLLSMLGTFFAAVALLLAAVGLYGVLDDAVMQRRREIGIRVAIGARAAHVLRTTTAGSLAMVGLGGLVGWAGAVLLARSLGALVYEVHATSPAMAAIPSVALLTVAALAALRPALHALRIDPARVLRE
ncbi:MAG: ADOP family duplicated permease [Vicinamibacteraceae bacterium]